MSVAASGRTWDDATTPAAMRLTRSYEQAWKELRPGRQLPDPAEFLARSGVARDDSGARLALLRTDMGLRWDHGERVGVAHYLERFPELGEDSIVALIYEEFCLCEENGESPDPDDYLVKYGHFAAALRRVLDIHRLVGSATATTAFPTGSGSLSREGAEGVRAEMVVFPEAGQTIGGFHLVEELGRGAFARVFLARERQLADRPVALKVTRRGSREPQTLARLQHTHIVPVHSHRIDPATGLHLLCMPYFGRVTLGRLLAEVNQSGPHSGAGILAALDGLDPAESPPSGRSTSRGVIATHTFEQAIAWWGARLAEALGHAHDRGVLHRDIKPSNVLITGCGMPMLLDFNLAQESVLDPKDGPRSATLGGTVDYMSPEHLEALADGLSRELDGRTDIYSLGVLLFEALVGRKPFDSPRKGGSVFEALNRAADERRGDPATLFVDCGALSAALQAVICRCLEPDPLERYQSAAELATDLLCVVDDTPLVHAREPVASRLSGKLRRNRRRLAMAATILLAGAAVMGALVSFQIERTERYDQVQSLIDKGVASEKDQDFKSAEQYYRSASEYAERSELGTPRNLLRWKTFWGFGGKLRRKFLELQSYPDLEELDGTALSKAMAAKRIGETRGHALALHEKADGLRFRLIGLGEDQPEAVLELKQLLSPFYVLTSQGDWRKHEHIWSLLKDNQQEQLLRDVNELLFLWMAGIDSAFRNPTRSVAGVKLVNDPRNLELALAVCDKALSFAEPKEPWLALRELLQRQGSSLRQKPDRSTSVTAGRVSEESSARDGRNGSSSSARTDLLPGEPAWVGKQGSALACFQWGLLCSSLGRQTRAIEWMRRAVQLDWSNYWYQFYLGYLDDEAGLEDDALNHYSVAVGVQPRSPWVRFSRARLYRAKGLWDWAIDDLSLAETIMRGRPEVSRVRLELGYVYQALGEFDKAREEYNEIIAEGRNGPYVRAARLNLANIDAESGKTRDARGAYDDLLASNPDDVAARMSRAFLLLRTGRAESAVPDLDEILRGHTAMRIRDEVLQARAIAYLVLGHPAKALADASECQRVSPSAGHERLRQRALLAAGHFDELMLDRPEDIALLPVSGPSLESDLRRAISSLELQARGHRPDTYRASLSLAVLLAGQGAYPRALDAAGLALAISPFSPRARLIRARVLRVAGDRVSALEEIERGLKLQTDEPGLLELRGVIRTEQGRPAEALVDFDQAIAHTVEHHVHLHKADALMALGDHEGAMLEWNWSLRFDPELAQALLGRALCYIKMRLWDPALADLEKATSWAHSDRRLEIGIVAAYLQVLEERPDRRARWISLARRAALPFWGLAEGHFCVINAHVL